MKMSDCSVGLDLEIAIFDLRSATCGCKMTDMGETKIRR